MDKRLFLTDPEAILLQFLVKQEFKSKGPGMHPLENMMHTNLLIKLDHRIGRIPE